MKVFGSFPSLKEGPLKTLIWWNFSLEQSQKLFQTGFVTRLTSIFPKLLLNESLNTHNVYDQRSSMRSGPTAQIQYFSTCFA